MTADAKLRRRPAEVASVLTPGVAGSPAEECLDDYVMQQIGFKARQLGRRFSWNRTETDDVQQEMALSLLKAKHKHDPSKCAWRTFADRTLSLRYGHLMAREIKSRKRQKGRPLGPQENPDGCPTAVNNPLPARQDEFLSIDRTLDIEQIMGQMPEKLRAVCELLKEHAPQEAAALLGLHRSSVYRFIAEIRDYFELADYGPEDR